MRFKQDLNKQILRFWENYFAQPKKVTGVVITIFGTVGLIIILNFMFYLLNHNTGIGSNVRKWDSLLNLSHPVETIVLGDSSGDQGVLPDIIEEKLGGSVINLATRGNFAPLYNGWMVNTYVKKFGAPRDVILVCTALTYAMNASLDCVNQIPLPWGFWENMEPKPSWIYDRNVMLLIFVDRYFPLYSQKLEISGILQTPGMPRIYQVLLDRIAMGKIEGVYVNPDPVGLAADSQSMLKAIREKPFELSSDNERSLYTIINLAKQYNFKVYLVNSPIYEQVYNDPSYKIYFDKFSNDITKYIDNKTTFLLFKRPMTFTNLQMQNPNHLIYSAAQIYTSTIASEILNIQVNNSDTLLTQ